MQVYRATKALLSERLDPMHYNPSLLAMEVEVKRVGWASLNEWVAESGIGHTAAVTPHYATSDEAGVPFVAGASIKDGLLDTSHAERIKLGSHDSVMKASSLSPGTLVTVRKGELGNSAVVPDGLPAVNCSSEVMFFHLKNPAEAGFLSSYFNSTYGRAVFLRQQRGMMIPSISLLDVPDIAVPQPHADARTYIGSKVRQAENLRSQAQAAERLFAVEFILDCGASVDGKRSHRVEPFDLDLVLKPGRFVPDRLAVRRALNARDARLLGDLASIEAKNTSHPAPSTAYLGLDGISSHSIDLTVGTVASADVRGDGRVLQPGPVISKLRPYLNKAAYVPASLAGAVGSTELLCVVPHDLHPAYVYGVLKLDSSLRQLRPLSSGATHPRIAPDDVLDLLVPMHHDHMALGAALERAQQQYFAARSLTTTARLLVEALIERKLTETDLAVALNDPESDRALLSRLTDKGLDGGGTPLFPDLTSLTALLSEGTGDFA